MVAHTSNPHLLPLLHLLKPKQWRMERVVVMGRHYKMLGVDFRM